MVVVVVVAVVAVVVVVVVGRGRTGWSDRRVHLHATHLHIGRAQSKNSTANDTAGLARTAYRVLPNCFL